MAFSGGTFSRTFDCTTDRDNGVKILASKFDTELDGMAVGLSTAILKDGTQTCTAAIPFAQGITIADNKTITLGTNSDVTIQYDETTNDSLEIAANVEGAALGIVLKADQGDDAGDEWKLNIADGGTLTLGNDINSAGTYVTHLTITPNSTVASSTTAVAGNLTVGGDLTVTGDDITMGTNTAGNLLIADGTNFNSVDVGSLSAISTVASGDLFVAVDASGGGLKKIDRATIVAGLATSAAITAVVQDTSPELGGDLDILARSIVSSSNRNISLTPNGSGLVRIDGNVDIQTGEIVLKNGGSQSNVKFYCESSNAHYAQLTAPPHSAFSGDVIIVLPSTAGTIALTSQIPTSGISSGNVATFTSGVADDDFLRVSGTSIEGRSAAEVRADIGATTIGAAVFTAANVAAAQQAQDLEVGVDVQAFDANTKKAGKETMWIPAVSMYPNTTNGCAAIAQTELSNGPEIKTLDFDKDSDEFAQFSIAFPKSWNEGTVSFQAFFTANSTNTGTTVFVLNAVALADNGDLNTAFGTAVGPTAKAMSGTANDLAVTAESGAMTIAGSPSTDEYVFFQLMRDVSEDSLAADAKLLGIKLFFTTDAANDA